jgi:carbamoyl-phosphate synthase large subunit
VADFWIGVASCTKLKSRTTESVRISNVQCLAKRNSVKVIECNLRASRSFPFVSKITGKNFAGEAMRRMLGVTQKFVNSSSLELDYVGVKMPMFSFSRLVGADPMLGVEMASTGEVGCLGGDLNEALLHGLLAAGGGVPQRGVLLSLGPVEDKYWFADEARIIAEELELPIYATHGTAEMLWEIGIPCTGVAKKPGNGLNALDIIDDGRVDLVINVPRDYDEYGRPDGYLIRRSAVDASVPLITDLQLARAIIEALRWRHTHILDVVAWNDYDAHTLSQ